jgi:uncharacterized protein (TIGR03118 family)
MPNPSSRAMSIAATIVLCLMAGTAVATDFFAIPLVTDDQGANTARIADPALIDSRGAVTSTSGPFCVANAGTGLATFYSVDPTTQVTTRSALSLTIPGSGRVTGVAFDTGTGFNGDLFLFASEDGTLAGWRAALGTTTETLKTADPANRYAGATFGLLGATPIFYSANFQSAAIDALDGSLRAAFLTGTFLDPNLPAGYAPFNVQNLGGTLYVAFAVRDASGGVVKGAGKGIVDAFDLQGNLLARIATGNVLDAPWGLAIAPASFGAYAGDLLVGNFGDGRIHAYDLATKTLAGTLSGLGSIPIVIDGLRSLRPGNGVNGGDGQSIYFTSGPGGGAHGLFGVITALPEPGTSALLTGGLLALVCAARFRGASRSDG